jgi:hypothetical protein
LLSEQTGGKKMRKLVVASALGAMALSLSACGGSPGENTMANGTKADEPVVEGGDNVTGNGVKTSDPVVESVADPAGNGVKTEEPAPNSAAPADNSAAPK